MLQLSNIKASRITNRVNLIFSDGSYLPFFIDDVVRLALHKGQDIDAVQYDIIKDKSLLYLGKEYALRQIAISPKTEKKLELKLRIYFQKFKKKYNITDINSVSSITSDIIADLNSRNLLNKTDFTSYFINKNRHKSRTETLYLLSQQGIETTPFVTNQLDSNNDLELIKKYFSKKRISPELLRDFKYRQKIMASLFRRGFKLSDIKTIIDDCLKLK